MPADTHKPFILRSRFEPAGDQPEAIAQLIDGLEAGLARQTLMGVTGSGKTFTVAKVIEHLQRPTLVLAPNKTLAAQLYGEFRDFFPENAVEYFVSYYDYYQNAPIGNQGPAGTPRYHHRGDRLSDLWPG